MPSTTVDVVDHHRVDLHGQHGHQRRRRRIFEDERRRLSSERHRHRQLGHRGTGTRQRASVAAFCADDICNISTTTISGNNADAGGGGLANDDGVIAEQLPDLGQHGQPRRRHLGEWNSAGHQLSPSSTTRRPVPATPAAASTSRRQRRQPTESTSWRDRGRERLRRRRRVRPRRRRAEAPVAARSPTRRGRQPDARRAEAGLRRRRTRRPAHPAGLGRRQRGRRHDLRLHAPARTAREPGPRATG